MAIPEVAFEAFEAFEVIPDVTLSTPLTEVAASTARVAFARPERNHLGPAVGSHYR